ncbi:MAG: hypothetical protein JXA57_18430 [Armatimonadetes bacterium]|nr:hypothetical protein [Armatimonadota bacterium]
MGWSWACTAAGIAPEHLAEDEGAVGLTRRGRPVAVLVSSREFRPLSSPSPKLFAFLERLRAEYDADHHGIEPGDLDGLRDQDPGRAVRL